MEADRLAAESMELPEIAKRWRSPSRRIWRAKYGGMQAVDVKHLKRGRSPEFILCDDGPELSRLEGT